MKTVYVAWWISTDGYEYSDGILGIYENEQDANKRLEDYLLECDDLYDVTGGEVRAEILWDSYKN